MYKLLIGNLIVKVIDKVIASAIKKQHRQESQDAVFKFRYNSNDNFFSE
jgi:hypothetical protein